MRRINSDIVAKQLNIMVDWSVEEACLEGRTVTPFTLFCEQNGVDEEIGSRIIDDMARYSASYANQTPIKKRIPESPTFSHAQAVAIVKDAFALFSPQMVELVEAADQEGRIFYDPALPPSQGTVHSRHLLPAGSRDLPREFGGKACINVPLQGTRLDINDVLTMGHEFGHLAAHDQNIHSEDFFPTNRPASETYALMGEFLVNDHFLQNPKYRELYAAVTAGEMTRGMLACIESATYAQDVNALCAKKLDQIAGADTGYETLLEAVVKSGRASKIIDSGHLFGMASYPLGLAASLQAFSKYKAGDETLARKWNNAAYQRLNLGQMMEHIGVDFKTPHVVDDTLVAYKAQKQNFLKELVQSRGKSLLIGRELEQRLGERADLAMIPFATQVGSIALTDALFRSAQKLR